VVLDLGRPLAAPPDADVPLPAVSGLRDYDDSPLAGLLISHPHLDHCGLAGGIADRVCTKSSVL
jgi:mRNA degradation ribonuclease J1/J2